MKPIVIHGLALFMPALVTAQNTSSIGSASGIFLEQEIGPLVIGSPGLNSPQQKTSADSALPSTTALQAQSASAAPKNFSQRITFDEYSEGTSITDQYRNRGIVFGGSGPFITPDLASSNSPVLSGTPLFEGDITGYFVLPGTTTPSTVYQMTWDIGEFDDVQSVQMDFFGPQGQTLYSWANESQGYYRYSARGGNVGIASWRFHIVTTEPAGFGIDNIYFSIPDQDDLGREMGLVGCALGNPVNPAVGNKFQLETDYLGARPFPLSVTRAYNSTSGSWQFLPEIRYQAGDVEVKIVRADGKTLTYTGDPSLSNVWRPSSTDMTGELNSTTDASGLVTRWEFTTLNDLTENYDANGQVLSVAQRSGVSHSYTYTPTGITVTHSLGGSITYGLDIAGVITGFTDPDGNDYDYNYSANGLLASVAYPNESGGRSYHYEDSNFDDLLTGITDANDNRFATWAYDSNRRAILSEHHNGADRTTFDYTYSDDPVSPRTTASNPLGKQTTYYYTTVNGLRKLYYVSGHPSANCVASNQSYTFNSRAFYASKTDWEGNVTRYVRDTKGRELSRIEAAGTAQERTINTEWHPTFNLPVKITEPGRETTFTYDADGNQLNRSVVDTTVP